MEFAAQETGSRVYNTISEGADEQLFLTFVFLFRHPSATEGSMEEREKAAPVLNGGAGAVVGTLRRIEELVKEGKI